MLVAKLAAANDARFAPRSQVRKDFWVKAGPRVHAKDEVENDLEQSGAQLLKARGAPTKAWDLLSSSPQNKGRQVVLAGGGVVA